MTVVLHVVTSEKAVRGIEKENKITFVVDAKASKAEIKQEIEKDYGEKVSKITTLIGADGRKKAVVSFKNANVASNLAAKLKVI
ncbi:50S ribosomal protein L23 [Candidatus Micrarchaeota archaeon]|nr:50S ribosomal protein L23 [Candidatus Micrarchaeota archaeon]